MLISGEVKYPQYLMYLDQNCQEILLHPSPSPEDLKRLGSCLWSVFHDRLSFLRILTIDPGTKCGWASLDVDASFVGGHKSVPQLMKEVLWGTWKLDTWNDEGAGMRYVRLLNYINELRPGIVIYEDTKNMKKLSTAAPVIYGGYVAVLQSWCTRFGVPYEGVTPGVIRKFMSGGGLVKKDAVPGELKKKYDISIDDPDAADAVAIMSYALESGLYKGAVQFHEAIKEKK